MENDIDEQIKNLSSYRLSFFQKLALCRGLDFAFPQRLSPMEVKVAFEKAFLKLEPKLSEENKELAAATLRSIVLNYVKGTVSRVAHGRLSASRSTRAVISRHYRYGFVGNMK